MSNDENSLEILHFSYWEHFKFEKELAMVLPVEHPKRILLRTTCNDLLQELHKLQEKIRKSNK